MGDECFTWNTGSCTVQDIRSLETYPILPQDLPSRWRRQAEQFRIFGGTTHALVLEAVADELERSLIGTANEPLTLTEAAAESGYTTRRLRQLVEAGRLPRDARGRVRRGDLPRRPGHRIADGAAPAVASRRQIARAIATES